MTTDDELLEGVRQAYSQAAACPMGEHPFPVGRGFAVEVGYPPELLEALPAGIEIALEAFSGVSNVSVVAPIRPYGAILDVGCGAGLDAMVAASRAGPACRVVGVDFSREMVLRARRATEEVPQISILTAEAGSLPLVADSIDLALVNGLFNLNPQRAALFSELARVVRPGGKVYAAEIVLNSDTEVARSRSNWFA